MVHVRTLEQEEPSGFVFPPNYFKRRQKTSTGVSASRLLTQGFLLGLEQDAKMCPECESRARFKRSRPLSAADSSGKAQPSCTQVTIQYYKTGSVCLAAPVKLLVGEQHPECKPLQNPDRWQKKDKIWKPIAEGALERGRDAGWRSVCWYKVVVCLAICN